MFFSIIIPVFNVKNYLKKCIDSILSQSYRNMEVILVDDGSTDGSSDLCDDYKNIDNRIVVIHQENEGVAMARNVGLRYAKGDYVLFVDGDDYWEGDEILSQLEQVIIDNKYPDLVINNSYFCVMPKGKKLEKHLEFNAEVFSTVFGENALLKFFVGISGFPWSVWKNIYKNQIIKENDIKFEKGITLGEDADWLFRFILSSKKISVIDIPYYCYRVNRLGSAMTCQSYKNLSSYLHVIDRWFKYADYTTNIELADAIRSKLSDNYMGYLKYIYGFEENERNEIISKMKSLKIIKYVREPKNIQLMGNIEKRGYEKVLKELYKRYVIREHIKKLAIKLRLIDR